MFFLSLLLQCKFANSTLLSLLSFSDFITPYDAQASSAFSALIDVCCFDDQLSCVELGSAFCLAFNVCCIEVQILCVGLTVLFAWLVMYDVVMYISSV